MPATAKRLHLHVKSCYFAQISDCSKQEEYRAVNPTWCRRLLSNPTSKIIIEEYLPYDEVVIYDAYKPTAKHKPLIFHWRNPKLKWITHPHFGPKPVLVFAIPLTAPTDSTLRLIAGPVHITHPSGTANLATKPESQTTPSIGGLPNHSLPQMAAKTSPQHSVSTPPRMRTHSSLVR